jgi:3-mercaptopyruvate sulfurtransferase SseA
VSALGAVRSAPRFDDNEAGIVTASTVRRWLAEPPAAEAEGELIILQFGPAAVEGGFLPSPTGVRTYDAPNLATLVQERSNGLFAAQIAPGRGTRLDSFLRNFAINPTTDRILIAAVEPSATAFADLARVWVSLRYWGIAHERIAILDGTLTAGFSSEELSNAPLAPPADGSWRFPELATPRFELLATIEDVEAQQDRSGPLLDLRTRAEFDGAALSTSGHDDTCLLGAPSCTALRGGRIRGANRLPLDAIGDPATLRWQGPEAIDAALLEAGLQPDSAPILYDADGSASAIATLGLLGISGRDARWYAGSFVEWSLLASDHPLAPLRALPEGSPWRLPEERFEAGGLFATGEGGVRPLVLDPAVASTGRITSEDRAYLANPPALPAVGAGDANCSR